MTKNFPGCMVCGENPQRLSNDRCSEPSLMKHTLGSGMRINTEQKARELMEDVRRLWSRGPEIRGKNEWILPIIYRRRIKRAGETDSRCGKCGKVR
jgi:hypothetical protein